MGQRWNRYRFSYRYRYRFHLPCTVTVFICNTPTVTGTVTGTVNRQFYHFYRLNRFYHYRFTVSFTVILPVILPLFYRPNVVRGTKFNEAILYARCIFFPLVIITLYWRQEKERWENQCKMQVHCTGFNCRLKRYLLVPVVTV